jgi:hypothetical protein
MAKLKERLMRGRVTQFDTHALVPSVRKRGEARIERGAEILCQLWKRIGEIFVFTFAKAVPRHDDISANIRGGRGSSRSPLALAAVLRTGVLGRGKMEAPPRKGRKLVGGNTSDGLRVPNSTSYPMSN